MGTLPRPVLLPDLLAKAAPERTRRWPYASPFSPMHLQRPPVGLQSVASLAPPPVGAPCYVLCLWYCLCPSHHDQREPHRACGRCAAHRHCAAPHLHCLHRRARGPRDAATNATVDSGGGGGLRPQTGTSPPEAIYAGPPSVVSAQQK
jgi:hypothetical protein